MTDFNKLNKVDRFSLSIVDLEDSEKGDLQYWLSKSVIERFAALEFLRQQYYKHGSSAPRLQRLLEIVEPAWG